MANKRQIIEVSRRGIGGEPGPEGAPGVGVGGMGVPPGGNNGEIVAWAAGVPTNIKPGRIDARVRGLSTAASASANKTVFDALAIEAASEGKELWIPDGTYPLDNGRIPSHARIGGTGTIQVPAGATTPAPLRILNGIENVEISGITIDGANLKSGIQVGAGNSAVPAKNVHVHNVTFRNIGATNPAFSRSAVSGILSDGLHIQNCTVESAVVAFELEDPTRLLIKDNVVRNTSDNFVSLVWYASMTDSGAGCSIVGNVAVGVGRMGIELYSSGGNQVVKDGLVGWNHIETTGVSMGVSSVTVRGARIVGNVLRAPNATHGNGIEVGRDFQHVEGNRVYGYLNGMSINSTTFGHILDNWVEGSTDGLVLASTGSGSRRISIHGNTIRNPIGAGIRIPQNSGGGNGALDVSDNLIIRDVAYTGDETRTFRGIAVADLSGFSRFHRNRIVQGQATPTAGFAFDAIQYSGTAGGLMSSEFHGNIIENMSASFSVTPFNEVTAATATTPEMSGNKSIDSAGVVTAANTWT